MVLKQLDIQGFKSFPDRTRVTIGPGITAVVGPNGSGKSNISDAIRWVLGETSSKQLRGSGKMEDVIFGGTQQRGAMGFASVELTVDNADRRLEVDADEVVIGRKYYRSGESEYSINGQSVRLRDVYELLLDTGLGRDGYSIIGQGKIAEIVGAKSGERREIFEEASGIAKFRYRKNEAERRLAGAEENLERLRDILGELESRVGPLERESKKAAQFLELSARRKELEVTLWVDSIHRARETVRDQQRRYETAQADYDRMTAEIEGVDAETEEIRLEMQRLSVDIEHYNTEIRAVTEEAAGADSQIAVLLNDIQHNTASLKDLQEELDQGSAGQESLNAEIARHRDAIVQIEATVATLDTRIAELQNQLESIQADSLKTGERRGAVAAAMAQMTQRQTDARVAAAGASSAAVTAAERLDAATAERRNGAARLDRMEEEHADTQKYLDTITENLTRLENIQNGLGIKLESRQRQLDQADAEEQRITREMGENKAKLELLLTQEQNMDGYQKGVKSAIRAAQERRLRGIVGTVNSLLTVKPGYELAIETALGAALQNIVAEDETASKAAIRFLQNTKGGRATFLPMDVMRGQHFSGSLTGSAVCASRLVHYDPRYDGIVSYLLGRIIVVDEMDEASEVARALNHRNKVVTVDGQVINAGGSYTGGSSERGAGLFSRHQEIETRRAEIKEMALRQEKAKETTRKWQAEVAAIRAELTATNSEAITAGGDKIRAEMEVQRLAAALSQQQAAAALLDGEIAALETQITQNRAEAEQQAAEDARLAAELEKFAAELNQLSAGDDSFLTTRSRLSDELNSKRLEQLSAQKDIGLHKAAIENLESRHGETNQRAADIARSLATLKEQNARSNARIEELRAAKESCGQRIAAREQDIRNATAARMEKEAATAESAQRVRGISDEREKMSQEMARLSERKAAAETEYDETVAKLWEEYQLTQSQAQELCVPFETVTALRAGVAEVRGKIRALGNVNVGAIEEYQEVSERYEFLKKQVNDVEKSKAELNRLIAELSGEMREIFSANFKAINENFGRIFRELFGGGTASLTLADADNVLESGIDIQVAPPGKVIKNLSALSGGEQALVAISIYFAILAVNPAPFCILDEIEAALDDVNVTRYAQYLRRITDKTQFIVITHRRGTMEAADVLYGVTMQDDGVSKLLKLDLEQVDASLVS